MKWYRAVGVLISALALVIFGAATAEAAPTSAGSGTFVSVPPEYVYNPQLKPTARHDYCTLAPNAYFQADFRGPCARHDLCYDAVDAGRATFSQCNTALRNDLITNCAYAYASASAAFVACRDVAYVYWGAVTITHPG